MAQPSRLAIAEARAGKPHVQPLAPSVANLELLRLGGGRLGDVGGRQGVKQVVDAGQQARGSNPDVVVVEPQDRRGGGVEVDDTRPVVDADEPRGQRA